jgi:hypothetical protein
VCLCVVHTNDTAFSYTSLIVAILDNYNKQTGSDVLDRKEHHLHTCERATKSFLTISFNLSITALNFCMIEDDLPHQDDLW